jgi:hypothetical protein
MEALVDAGREDSGDTDILQQLDDFKEDLGLCSMRSLDIFVNWYVWGGMTRGLSLTEIIEMPAWLLKDFRYLMQKYTSMKKEREEFDALVKEQRAQSTDRPNSMGR